MSRAAGAARPDPTDPEGFLRAGLWCHSLSAIVFRRQSTILGSLYYYWGYWGLSIIWAIITAAFATVRGQIVAGCQRR